jgi:hypothetical protein
MVIAHIWIYENFHKLVDRHCWVLMVLGEIQFLYSNKRSCLLLGLNLNFRNLVLVAVLVRVDVPYLSHFTVVLIELKNEGKTTKKFFSILHVN